MSSQSDCSGSSSSIALPPRQSESAEVKSWITRHALGIVSSILALLFVSLITYFVSTTMSVQARQTQSQSKQEETDRKIDAILDGQKAQAEKMIEVIKLGEQFKALVERMANNSTQITSNTTKIEILAERVTRIEASRVLDEDYKRMMSKWLKEKTHDPYK